MTDHRLRGNYRPSAHLVCLAVFAVVSRAGEAQQLPTRVTVDILVVAEDAVAVRQMKEWSNALQRRLGRLSFDRSMGMSRAISVTPYEQRSYPNPNTLQTRWQQRRAIQVVLAQGVRAGNRVTAEGDIFLGSLKGDLASPMVPIKQPITPETYQAASDYIMMTSLYALSVDAGAHKAVACNLLRQANLLGRRITASTDAANVKGAVTRRLARLRCGIGQ